MLVQSAKINVAPAGWEVTVTSPRGLSTRLYRFKTRENAEQFVAELTGTKPPVDETAEETGVDTDGPGDAAETDNDAGSLPDVTVDEPVIAPKPKRAPSPKKSFLREEVVGSYKLDLIDGRRNVSYKILNSTKYDVRFNSVHPSISFICPPGEHIFGPWPLAKTVRTLTVKSSTGKMLIKASSIMTQEQLVEHFNTIEGNSVDVASK